MLAGVCSSCLVKDRFDQWPFLNHSISKHFQSVGFFLEKVLFFVVFFSSSFCVEFFFFLILRGKKWNGLEILRRLCFAKQVTLTMVTEKGNETWM